MWDLPDIFKDEKSNVIRAIDLAAHVALGFVIATTVITGLILFLLWVSLFWGIVTGMGTLLVSSLVWITGRSDGSFG